MRTLAARSKRGRLRVGSMRSWGQRPPDAQLEPLEEAAPTRIDRLRVLQPAPVEVVEGFHVRGSGDSTDGHDRRFRRQRAGSARGVPPPSFKGTKARKASEGCRL